MFLNVTVIGLSLGWPASAVLHLCLIDYLCLLFFLCVQVLWLWMNVIVCFNCMSFWCCQNKRHVRPYLKHNLSWACLSPLPPSRLQPNYNLEVSFSITWQLYQLLIAIVPLKLGILCDHWQKLWLQSRSTQGFPVVPKSVKCN